MFLKEHNFEETLIGRYPKDWDIVVLGNVAKVKGGKRLPKGEKFADSDTGFPYIRVVDFRNGTIDTSSLKYLLPETQERIKKYTISSKDVYISIAGTIGLAGVIPPEIDGANLTENAAKLCELNQVEKRFLSYMLDSKVIKKQIAGLIGRGTQPKLALFRIESLKLPLPPIKEQKTIVGVLAVVETAIELADRVVAKTERLKKGLMQQLLTNGIGHTEYRNTAIGKIPKTWQIVTIGDVCGQRSDMFQPSENANEAFVGLEHVTSGEARLHDYAQDAAVKSSKFRFYAGDILYGKLRPYLDKAVLVDFEGICSTDLLVLKPKENVLEEFLVYVLHSRDFLKYAVATTSGTNYPRTSWSAIGKFKFGLADLSEQRKIAETLSAVDRKLELEKTEKLKLEHIKQGLLDLFLTGKIRVKVD